MKTSVEWKNISSGILDVIDEHHQEMPVAIGKLAKELGLRVKLATLDAGVSGEIKNQIVVMLSE